MAGILIAFVHDADDARVLLARRRIHPLGYEEG
jgi:hypothetical protein